MVGMCTESFAGFRDHFIFELTLLLWTVIEQSREFSGTEVFIASDSHGCKVKM